MIYILYCVLSSFGFAHSPLATEEVFGFLGVDGVVPLSLSPLMTKLTLRQPVLLDHMLEHGNITNPRHISREPGGGVTPGLRPSGGDG